MTYKKLRTEFSKGSFRKNIKKELGSKCVNCDSEENIEYHHIVPLKNGGTNRLSNIVPLCENCHYKAHDISTFKNKNGGRPKAIEFEDAEKILSMYYNLKIGTKKTKELLGLSATNKSTFPRLKKQYEEKYGIKNFYNNIDLLASQNKRLGV
ncbi:HNH endonuclease signature motif containing protein [Paraclostridium bifermentans]|uniref:HNH endonuclease signature motif containing protein n=1 Tax=Paraclostridium bifermentans TaxID=1490 RepID=UPI0018A9453A|nr:HNH endonuclease signature motif containing protein [Paraclostridium bifermentans]